MAQISSLKHCTVRIFVERFNSLALAASLWTRSLLGRDEAQMELFRNLIRYINLKVEWDKLIWVPGDGTFTTKKFTQTCLQNSRSPSHSIGKWKLIWAVK